MYCNILIESIIVLIIEIVKVLQKYQLQTRSIFHWHNLHVKIQIEGLIDILNFYNKKCIFIDKVCQNTVTHTKSLGPLYEKKERKRTEHLAQQWIV